MVIVVTIPFVGSVPSPAMIRDRVRASTGIDVDMIVDHGSGVLKSNEFRRPCEFAIHPDKVTLDLPPGAWSYLEYATLAALIDMGGEYPKPLPDFARMKWQDRRWWQRWPKG